MKMLVLISKHTLQRATLYMCEIDIFSWYVLFFQYRSYDNTLEDCFFLISSYSCAYIWINYEKTMDQVPVGPLLGKQNIQAKEVYCFF